MTTCAPCPPALSATSASRQLRRSARVPFAQIAALPPTAWPRGQADRPGLSTEGVDKLEREPECLCDRGGAHSLALGGLWFGGIHCHMDRERPIECRDRDVRHCFRLADHQPRREPNDRVPGPGRRQPATVPVHPAVRRLGGRHRFPAAADRGRTRDSRPSP